MTELQLKIRSPDFKFSVLSLHFAKRFRSTGKIFKIKSLDAKAFWKKRKVLLKTMSSSFN